MDREQKKRLLKAVSILLGLGAFALFFVFVWHPPCPILRLTGFICPGCGGQRMLLSLLRGDISGAFRHNPLLFLLLPLGAAYALWEAIRYVRGKRPLWKGRGFVPALAAVLFVTLAFTVLRNLPGFQWLGPG